MKTNGHATGDARPNSAVSAPTILLGTPRPLLETEGTFHAICIDFSWAWTRRYKRNQAMFTFDPPLDYRGPSYPGVLCAFAPLGHEQGKPYAACGGLQWIDASVSSDSGYRVRNQVEVS